MDSSSTSSSDPARGKRAPRAFLLAASLVLASEAALEALVPPNPGRHDVDAMLHRLEAAPPAAEAILLGDSVSLRALDGTPALARVQDLCANMAVGIPGNACLLRRVLGSDPRLRAVFLVFLPDTWEYGMDTERAMTYFESCFVRLPELRMLWKARGPDRQFLRALRNRFVAPPSMRRRGVVFAAIPALDAIRVRDPDPVFRWLPPVRKAATEERSARAPFAESAIARLYADDVFRRTKEAGVRVYVLTAPIQTGVFAAWRGSGRLRKYEEFLAALPKEWDHVEVVPAETFAHFPEECFYDSVHLDAFHQARYGRELSALILRLLDGSPR